jgi:hypothetical protein
MSLAIQPVPAEAVESRLAAIVLAAGYSSRMAEFKPLLPLAGSTALERCIGLFCAACVAEVIVVLGHRAEELQPLAERAGARCIFNSRFEQGMFSSISAGSRALSSGVEAGAAQYDSSNGVGLRYATGRHCVSGLRGASRTPSSD